MIYLASSYGHLGRLEEADDAIDAANALRNAVGLGELSLRPAEGYAAAPTDKHDFKFRRFGATAAQEHLRAGLTEIPALKWQYLVTVYRRLGPYNSSFDVAGATQVDLAAAKQLHDQGAVFIDVSGDSMWAAGHVPGAVHLSWETSVDPSKTTYGKKTLREAAGKDDEIVLYFDDGNFIANPSWEAAKAVVWGFNKVNFFDGGARAWQESGYPVETGQ